VDHPDKLLHNPSLSAQEMKNHLQDTRTLLKRFDEEFMKGNTAILEMNHNPDRNHREEMIGCHQHDKKSPQEEMIGLDRPIRLLEEPRTRLSFLKGLQRDRQRGRHKDMIETSSKEIGTMLIVIKR
jgi:hypothetical protein